jgi:hypothetical protein
MLEVRDWRLEVKGWKKAMLGEGEGEGGQGLQGYKSRGAMRDFHQEGRGTWIEMPYGNSRSSSLSALIASPPADFSGKLS